MEIKTMYRIIAGEGKAVTKDGTNLFLAVDTDNTQGWYEVDAPELTREPVSAEQTQND